MWFKVTQMSLAGVHFLFALAQMDELLGSIQTEQSDRQYPISVRFLHSKNRRFFVANIVP
jgi:hypothetical protein